MYHGTQNCISNPARPRALFLVSAVATGSLERLSGLPVPVGPKVSAAAPELGRPGQVLGRAGRAVGAEIFLTSECFSGETKYSFATFLQLFQKAFSCDWFLIPPPQGFSEALGQSGMILAQQRLEGVGVEHYGAL